MCACEVAQETSTSISGVVVREEVSIIYLSIDYMGQFELALLVLQTYLLPCVCLLSYPVFTPKPCTHRMHDPGSIIPHIQSKVFTDNQMSRIEYNYYINSASKTMMTLSKMK
jgi:hypothetical protein